MSYPIRHDFHAIRNAGTVPASSKIWIVLHNISSTNLKGAAEGAGSWFENRACRGSTQYGCDNDSVQQYLPDLSIPWGAPSANREGIHIEQMGTESWTREKWTTLADETIKRAAWLTARLSAKYDIPLRYVKGADLRAHKKGITTHEWVTRAFNIAGGHTDPGPNYPYDLLLDYAQDFAAGRDPSTEADDQIPERLYSDLKVAMVAYAKAQKLPVPTNLTPGKDVWREPARILADRVSLHLRNAGKKVPRSARPTKALAKALAVD